MVHMECMCRAYGVHVSCHLVDEAEEAAGSSRLCDGDARARCAAQRERRRAEAGGIVTGGEEGAQAHDVQRGGGGSAEGEDVTRVGRAAVVCEQERACYVQRMRSALCSTWHVQCVCVCMCMCMCMCMCTYMCMCMCMCMSNAHAHAHGPLRGFPHTIPILRLHSACLLTTNCCLHTTCQEAP